MPLRYRALLRLTLPIALLCLAGFLLTKVPLLDSSNVKLLGYVPYLLCGLATLLALQFNRSRLLASSTLVAVSFWCVQSFLQSSLTDREALYVYTAISLLLPLNIAILAFLPERGLWNHFGFLYLLITPLLVAGAYWLYQTETNALANLPEVWQIKSIEGYILSIGASIVFVLALFACLLMLCLRNNESEAILALCLTASYITLGWLQLSMVSTVLFATAAMGIIVGVFRSSHEMAYRDELTGLQGRRALNERMRGLGKRYCIAMLDIDHFKKLNDNHGHDIGDEVLKLVAARLSQIGGGATTYRYGGEEFCAIFPQRDLEDCIPHLEEIREELAAYRMAIRDTGVRPTSSKEGSGRRGQATKGVGIRVTISIGLAEHTDQLQSPEDVLKLADKALYTAKQKGRNRLCY
jgi:diguanylate cyclase (GGDEF)-like protein